MVADGLAPVGMQPGIERLGLLLVMAFISYSIDGFPSAA